MNTGGSKNGRTDFNKSLDKVNDFTNQTESHASADFTADGNIYNYHDFIIDHTDTTELNFTVKINGAPLTAPNEMAAMYGKTGVGKSAVMFSFINAILSKHIPTNFEDSIGWETTFDPEYDILVYVETEESDHSIGRRIRQITDQPIDDKIFTKINLLKLSPEGRKQAIEQITESIKKHYQKRVWIIINQFQDLLEVGSNEETPSKQLLAWFLKQNFYFSLVVLQDNESNGANGKPAGHFGNEAMRKCRGSLRIEKHNEVQTLKLGYKCTHAHKQDFIIEFEGLVAQKVGDRPTKKDQDIANDKQLLIKVLESSATNVFPTAASLAEAIKSHVSYQSRNITSTIIPRMIGNSQVKKEGKIHTITIEHNAGNAKM